MSIEQAFSQQHGEMPGWLKERLEALGDDKEQCIILTVENFKKLAVRLYPQMCESSGLWSLYFWHKSHAIVDGSHWTVRSPAFNATIGPRFEYFHTHHGPGFATEWCEFAAQVSGDFVLLTGKEVHSESAPGKLFFSGGRPYHEPSSTAPDDFQFE